MKATQTAPRLGGGPRDQGGRSRVSEGIRTPDSRNHNPPPDSRNDNADSDLRRDDPTVYRPAYRDLLDAADLPADLRAIIDAWPRLDESVRRCC